MNSDPDTVKVGEEAVEAVARMLYRNEGAGGHPRRPKWDEAYGSTREEFRSEATDLVQAAYPAILKDLRKQLLERMAERMVSPSPYAGGGYEQGRLDVMTELQAALSTIGGEE